LGELLKNLMRGKLAGGKAKPPELCHRRRR
jgi:hypothetical protein